MSFLCYKWGSCNVKWNLANWKWSECLLVEEVIAAIQPAGVDASLLVPPWLKDPKTEEEKKKRRRFIRLICKVKNEPEYDEKKPVNEDAAVTIEDVKLVVRAVAGIDLNVKE